MTKADIVAEISEKTGIEKVAVQATVEAFMNSIKDSIVSGENVYLRGFGSFIVKKRAQKTGRNISKNVTIIIPEHFIPAFKPAKAFVEKVKNNVTSDSNPANAAAAFDVDDTPSYGGGSDDSSSSDSGDSTPNQGGSSFDSGFGI